MENKEMATSRKITGELIGGWFLYGILFGIIYSIISTILIHIIQSRVLQAIIVIILQGFTMLSIWSSSTAATFKKRTMDYNDVSIVMKNLTIFTVIVCVINGIYNYSKVNNAIEEAVNSNFKLQFAESQMSYLYNEDEIEEYQKEKSKAIEEAQKQLYVYLTILEIGLTVVYLLILPFEKKQILKYIN